MLHLSNSRCCHRGTTPLSIVLHLYNSKFCHRRATPLSIVLHPVQLMVLSQRDYPLKYCAPPVQLKVLSEGLLLGCCGPPCPTGFAHRLVSTLLRRFLMPLRTMLRRFLQSLSTLLRNILASLRVPIKALNTLLKEVLKPRDTAFFSERFPTLQQSAQIILQASQHLTGNVPEVLHVFYFELFLKPVSILIIKESLASKYSLSRLKPFTIVQKHLR